MDFCRNCLGSSKLMEPDEKVGYKIVDCLECVSGYVPTELTEADELEEERAYLDSWR